MIDGKLPGIKSTIFKVIFDKRYFDVSDLLLGADNTPLRVLSSPKRSWYKVLFQYLSFGLYKAGWEYKVKFNWNDI